MAKSDLVFVDACVLIEVLLGRVNSKKAQDFLVRPRLLKPVISSLTAHLIVHFGLAITSQDILEEFLGDYTIVPLKKTDFEWAFRHNLSDFEDALQYSCALSSGAHQIVTFDKNFVKQYTSYHTPSVILL
jgi:predicted nucleic-acid-binding protein